MSTAMLSFKLGPVQPFIEAARTLRDLWSGSYLLSWLTAHGMTPLFENGKLKAGVTFITPDVDVTANPLLRAVVAGRQRAPDATLACLPHTFAAEVPADQAEGLRTVVVEAVKGEWARIAVAVKEKLEMTLRAADPQWDAHWASQIDSFFEVRCVAMKLNEATDAVMDQLVVEKDDSQDTPENARWGRRWNLLSALMDVSRSVRHVPPYTPTKADKYPVKCSLLGSYEQMGPAEWKSSNAFWERVASPNWKGFNGTRLQTSDKLCAVSLVKRFAWAAYWAGRLGLAHDELRFTDTATMAAGAWLANANPEPLIPDVVRKKCKKWSGQWLHWATQADDEDESCHDDEWNIIRRKKHKQGSPPTYYALLLLDGDNMGKLFQGDIGRALKLFGVQRFQAITRKLTTFALDEVRGIVEGHQGELIYAGGDDVLAFLPTETVVECARQLREAFGKALPGATLSGGIAVVHYKEDLRFALGQVRAAEKKAKHIGKDHGDKGIKDALAITVCKRSGEHGTVVTGWDETAKLQELVAAFKGGASDRWAYKLRAELETLKGVPLAAGRAEALRLAGRGDSVTGDFQSVIETLFEAYQQQMQKPTRHWPDADVLTGFVGLCQTASFLARGKE